MSGLIYHDSNGASTMYNENGRQMFQAEMDVNQETHPLDNITDFDEYMHEKPLEKVKRPSNGQRSNGNEIEEINEETPRTYKAYKEKEKEAFFELYYNRGMSARAAALQLNTKVRTAQDWAKKDQTDPQDIITRRGASGRKPGRLPIFNKERAKYLENLVDEKPDVTIADIMESLVKDFEGLKISKSGLYKFMTEKCCVSIKQSRYHSVERNSPEKLQERFD